MSLLSCQIQDNKKFYEEEIKSLNDQIGKQRNKLASANDRLRKVENKLKGMDQSITLQRNITSDEINQVKDEIVKLRDHVEFSAKDLHKRCKDLSNEFKPICYSVKSQTEEIIMSKSEDISGNELRELQCQTNISTNHFQKGALDGINKISTDAVDISEKPILTCVSNDAPNNTNFTVKKATEHNI